MKRLLLMAVLMMSACKKNRPLPVVVTSADVDVLSVLTARETPDVLQARFGIKLKSKVLGMAGTTTGGLVVEQPTASDAGRVYFAILTPLGGPVFAITTDGTSLGILNAQDKVYVLGEGTQFIVGEEGTEQVDVDQLAALLLGRVAIQPERVTHRSRMDDDVLHVRATGPGGTLLSADLDVRSAAPRRLALLNDEGETQVQLDYGPFEVVDGMTLPSEVTLTVPSVELTVDLRYKSFKELDEAPDVF
ncbi:MAG: hypothetical protein ACON4N_05735, partial [Myxococcota bacterium]